jgi:4-amino-4-deoxy-L-arabinose transferase-like glycosyltransferase
MLASRHWQIAVGGGLLLVAVLYFARLNESPPYLSIEELETARQAISIATTGRSLSGQLFPLYLGEPGFQAGRDPVWVYLDAALLKLFPFSEALLRVPSALAGVLDVALMFVLAHRLFGTRVDAAVAALLLALTPAHFIMSRLAIQQIGPLPFVLAWLILISKFLETKRPSMLFWAAAILGLGIYAYLSLLVMAPLLFAATLVALRSDRHAWPAALAGFALALLPYVAWTALHPERFQQLTSYYSAHGYNQDLADRNVSLVTLIVNRCDTWWDAFNPERLFFFGDSNYRFSTRQVGYFLWPVAPFLVVGLFTVGRLVPRPVAFLIGAGLALAPLPAVVTNDNELKRWLTFVVFVILTATAGVRMAWASGARTARAAIIVAAGVCLLQFAQFLRDYHGDYHARAADLLGNNAKGAVEQVLATTRDLSCVFFDTRTGYLDRYWQLYARVYGHAQFAERGRVVDSARADFEPPRSCTDASLVVIDKELRDDATYAARLSNAGWTPPVPIPQERGRVVYSVLHWQNPGGAP